uniref:Uncharacterized protein n=1 Tax=Xenopus tropicalis TaxID=8364 RepID=A0A803J4N6_XENTR
MGLISLRARRSVFLVVVGRRAKTSLQCINWQRLFTGLSTEGKWYIFKIFLNKYTCQYIPLESKERHCRAKPLWLNKSLRGRFTKGCKNEKSVPALLATLSAPPPPGTSRETQKEETGRVFPCYC